MSPSAFAYLWLWSNHRRDLAQTVAGSLREWRQFFWARKVADDLRRADGNANGNGRKAIAERTGEATEPQSSPVASGAPDTSWCGKKTFTSVPAPGVLSTSSHQPLAPAIV